ncbi:MAG: hypothetical protein GYA23_03585 [Methanomicrobiales archaeon]|nr:hypothetical protein [Methanomicrobiales archaeon]
MAVIRGKPYVFNGTADIPGIREVQIWVLSDTVHTTRVPVMEDGTFQFVLGAEETRKLSGDFTEKIVIQYPSSSGNFSVNYNAESGRITGPSILPENILSELNDKKKRPTVNDDYLDVAITRYGEGNFCDLWFVEPYDAHLALDTILPSPPGIMNISGTTDLPAGTQLSVEVITDSMHPTPKNYDWSHEMADGTAVVSPGMDQKNHFSGTVDTSLLRAGLYLVSVRCKDPSLIAYTFQQMDIIPPPIKKPSGQNYINWSALSLPPLQVNASMQPVMLEGELMLVPQRTGSTNNEIPYGTIIDCGTDSICRIFDKTGIQTLAAYDSNQMRILQVPSGAAIDGSMGGNVTRVSLNGEVILTKINEHGEYVS